MDNNISECVQYFKSNDGYKRLFEALRDRYISLGHLGGTIRLCEPSALEREAIRNLMLTDFSDKDVIVIPVLKIQKALKNTRFEMYNIDELLEAYFGKRLVSNTQRKQSYESERQIFFNKFIESIQYEPVRNWLSHIINHRRKPYASIINKYKTNKAELTSLMSNVINALTTAAKNTDIIRLPVFAAKITGNPHYFDDGNEAGPIFTLGLSFILNTSEPTNAAEKAELFFRVGIIKSDITNVTVCYGLEAYADGEVHKGWAAFAQAHEPLMLSLSNISKISRIIPSSNSANTTAIFCFENPAVFSAVLDSLPNCPALLCTNGQPRLATLIILDKLVAEGVTVYYSGDFDPEGLLIADNLKNRYGNQLVLWRFTETDYISALSNEIFDITRLKKLDKLVNIELIKLAEILRINKRSGYQEQIIDKYIQDIKGL